MHTLFAGIHLKDKANEFFPLENIDFDRNVHYLKEEIAKKVQCDAIKLEIIYRGTALKDEKKLLETVRPNGTVHCFNKTKQYTPYVPPEDITNLMNTTCVHVLLSVISNTQISVNSRVNILQKVLAEYPEFRHNLGAQALIRDSVLFNNLHNKEVVDNIAYYYPIICDAASFMVDTIKKELARSSSTTNSEPATDSTNSSEEENTVSASTSTDRRSGPVVSQSEQARIRMISRQQLHAALTRIGGNSVNSLSNIAQRNSDADRASGTATTSHSTTANTSAPLSNSASGDRISSTLFRSELQRALESLSQRVTTSAVGNNEPQQQGRDAHEMDTTETVTTESNAEDGSDELPAQYRTHQYANQLRTMVQMGLINYEDNLVYLTISNGDIDVAVNLIMGGIN
uniref:Ubiquitin-like protein 7 n=2 Tax=Ceratitis capitata TaxID=7213 RepID=W8C810_CERCA